MAKNGKYIKQFIHISRSMHFVRNGEEKKLHKTVLCEGGLKLEDIGIKNVKKDELNPRLECYTVRLEKLMENLSRRGERIHRSMNNNVF